MNHGDLIRNHILENWVFPNAAARNAAGLYQPYDIGKIGYQTDLGTYWRLLSVTPTWALILPAKLFVSGQPTNPTGTTSTTGVMMGLGMSFTPLTSGRMFVVITGSISNSAASAGAKVEPRYAGGSIPTNGASPAGAAIGKAVNLINNASTAGLRVPFTVSGVIGGASIGVGYWVDVLLAAVTSGTATVFDVTVTIIEL